MSDSEPRTNGLGNRRATRPHTNGFLVHLFGNSHYSERGRGVQQKRLKTSDIFRRSVRRTVPHGVASERREAARLPSERWRLGIGPRRPAQQPWLAERGTKVGEIWKSLLGVIIGGCIAAGTGAWTTYLAALWAADNQRKQFLFERAQSFSEFIALQYLPRSGDVPPECQTRLEECRRLRQSAVQIYLFLPYAAQKELIKSYGSKPNTPRR